MHENQSTTRILQRHLQYDLKSDIEVSNINFLHYLYVFSSIFYIPDIQHRYHIWSRTYIYIYTFPNPNMFGMLNFRPCDFSCQKCHPFRNPKRPGPSLGRRNRAMVQARRLRASRVDHNLTKRPLSVPDAWQMFFKKIVQTIPLPKTNSSVDGSEIPNNPTCNVSPCK